MLPIGILQDDGWKCKGSEVFENKKCLRNCTKTDESFGWNRFRCLKCYNYNFCDLCAKKSSEVKLLQNCCKTFLFYVMRIAQK
jgi:hypothetical protein